MSPLSPSDTRSLLDQLEHHPVRKLGQNFLIDGNIVRKSLDLARISPSDTVVEIGPGLGTLSRALIEVGANVYAIEKDKRLAAYLESQQEVFTDRFHLRQGDAMDNPLADLPSETADFKIVANLPYAISTPWLESVLSGPNLPISMTLMLQKEAALRYIAKAGTKQFGNISVFLHAAYEISDTFNVKAQCFFPKPDVDSSLLHITRKLTPHRFNSDSKTLIRELFQQRRKQIGAILRKSQNPLAASWSRNLESLELSSTLRAEQIATTDWIRLSETT